jgi:nucleoside-diphosphate-sugar epimerase
MIARAFHGCMVDNPMVTFYAAGVSNSQCGDERDFTRERERLEAAFDPNRTLVYFGTCATAVIPYVKHKHAMEELVKAQPKWLIARLPNVIGRTPNPHTLFNYLYARIARGERFTLYRGAFRRIVDVDDVVHIVELALNVGPRNVTINAAPGFDYSVSEIVEEFEAVTGRRAIFDQVDCGHGEGAVDTGIKLPHFRRSTYLRNCIEKYYG